jgi:hypothetical protein
MEPNQLSTGSMSWNGALARRGDNERSIEAPCCSGGLSGSVAEPVRLDLVQERIDALEAVVARGASRANDYMADRESEGYRLNGEAINRSRLRVDARPSSAISIISSKR